MIFEKNEELDRQGVYSAPDLVQGPKKAMMAALGYKNTGEANTWGKVLNVMPNVTAIGRNALAGALSKGTDTNQVIKGQRDEAFNDSMQGLALGIKVAQAATGFGAIGGMAGLGQGVGAIGGITGLDQGVGLSKNSLNFLQGLQQQKTLQKAQEELDADLEGMNTDEILNKNVSGNPENNMSTMPLTENKKIPGQGLAKINNTLGAMGVVGDLSQSIANNVVSGIALNKAGESEYDKLKRESMRQSTLSYL